MWLIVGGIVVVGVLVVTAMMAKRQPESMVRNNGQAYTGTNNTAFSSSKDITDNLNGTGDYSVLVSALKAGGLTETLKGKGPFTVFAPTNGAINKLPKNVVDSLLKPENKAELVKVLTYHVVPGKYTTADLKDGMKLKTLQGQELMFSNKDGKWSVNNSAMVTVADGTANNGVIHVVDAVLLPK